ncbi:hypothetical protein JP75_20290 [Devosia riboflavina]|uniref:Pentapeptide repeat-containing protein n=1 Tax=Devosia riboflavina TaxID=46914 RepID=A0A087LY18_9HYPH|nr:hypothetical protein [Devosia riboflavina]KFL29521.1 hypothetical protein JP75_20290 [Devosia riboflavina]
METDFSADCGKCFALCCTALSFERGRQFGHDKAAGQPCHNLAGDFRCTIHARREELGYDGCEEFDCLGAGQRASAIFAAENWRRDPPIARRLYASFSLLLRLQEMRRALVTAAELDIGEDLHGERLALLEQLATQADSLREDIGEEASKLLKACREFLRQLRFVIAA